MALEALALGSSFRFDVVEYHATAGAYSDVHSPNPLRMKATWVCGVFYLVYVGLEGKFAESKENGAIVQLQ